MSLERAVVCVGILLPACGSSSSPTTSDAGDTAEAYADVPVAHGDAQAAGAPDDGGQDGPAICNTLVNSASAVTVMQVAADPTAFEGGTPSEGTYHLMSETVYTGAGGASGPTSRTERTTLQITGNLIQVAKDTSPTRETYMLVPNGTTYAAEGLCPPMLGGIVGSYTATTAMFIASLAAPGGDGGAPWTVDSFTKQ
jgi:hypothetical protein